jgi:hypothetical protein
VKKLLFVISLCAHALAYSAAAMPNIPPMPEMPKDGSRTRNAAGEWVPCSLPDLMQGMTLWGASIAMQMESKEKRLKTMLIVLQRLRAKYPRLNPAEEKTVTKIRNIFADMRIEDSMVLWGLTQETFRKNLIFPDRGDKEINASLKSNRSILGHYMNNYELMNVLRHHANHEIRRLRERGMSVPLIEGVEEISNHGKLPTNIEEAGKMFGAKK